MKYCFYIALIFILLSCNNSGRDKVPDTSPDVAVTIKFPDSLLQKKIRDTLRTLPMIKKLQAYFDSVSNHKEGVTFIMDTLNNSVHVVAVYYDHALKSFQRLDKFIVNPKNMEIRISDINSGNYITIEEYYKLDSLMKY